MRKTTIAIGILTALLSAPAWAQGTHFICQGDGCPSRYVIEGFEVYISPAVFENPAFTHQRLGRFLDTLQSQLVYLTSEHVIPMQAINRLRESRLSIYYDDSENRQEWWPCDAGMNACYSPALNRIGGSFWGEGGNVIAGYWWNNFILHELAHAYHYQVIYGRFDNQCVNQTYMNNRFKYENVEEITNTPHQEGGPVRVRHWAAKDANEYFATLTETYFRTQRQFYPWNRNELFKHDPDGYHLIRQAWENPGFCQSGPQFQTPIFFPPNSVH